MPHVFACARLARLALAAALLPAWGNVAAENWVGGFVMGDVNVTEVRTDRLNPGNNFQIADASTTLALLLEGQYENIDWRVRGHTIMRSHDGSLHGRGSLQELNKVFKVSDNVTLSVGKRLYSLDQSYIGQPLGFFQKQVDLSDPTDSAGSAEGLPMIVLSWATERASLSAIYSNDLGTERDGFNRGIRQFLLRFGYEFSNLSASLIVRQASGESTGAGGTFSSTLGELASVYGSFYTARGTLRPSLSQGLLDAPRFVVGETGVIGSYRQDNGVAYPRAAVGAIYTPREGSKVQLELIYDRRGMSDENYKRFIGLVDYHQHQAPAGAPAILTNANLALDARVLLARGARRKYASVSADQSFDKLSVGGGAYIGLEDGTATYYVSASYLLSKSLSASLSGATTRGGRDSEFRLSPVSNVLTARVKFNF